MPDTTVDTPPARPRGVGVASMLVLAAVTGLALALAQIAVSFFFELLMLTGAFEAGAERTQGVTVTLLVWYVALAVVIGARTAAGTAGAVNRWVRLTAAPAAALGALAVLPYTKDLTGGFALGDDMAPAFVNGALVGLVAAVLVILLPEAGAGVSAHAGLLWTFAVVGGLFSVRGATAYAGLYGSFLPEWLDDLLFTIMPPLPGQYGYHLQRSLPAVIALVVLGGVLAARIRARTGSRLRALAAVLAGPVLAVAAYAVDTSQLYLWNEYGLGLVAATAVLTLLVAGIVVLVGKGRGTAP